MLSRLLKASAVVAGVGLVTAGCAVTPLKMGSAAIVGSQRISIATLDSEVGNLSQAVKKYPAAAKLNATQQTQATLGWLIQFQVFEELARQQGITVTSAQATAALKLAVANAEAAAAEQGLTHVRQAEILAASGIPPNEASELGRYEAIATRYLAIANGGTAPAQGSSAQTAAGKKLNQAQCQAAKALNIQVNPQFGELDYTALQVVSSPVTVTRTQGPVQAASPVATAPAC